MGAPKPLPWRGFSTLSFAKGSVGVATLWIMCRPLVEGPRNESVSTLGVFDDAWPLLRHDRYLSNQHNCTQQLCPIRRDEYSHAYMWMWPSQGRGWVDCFTTELCKRGQSAWLKAPSCLWRICFWSTFSYIWLKMQSAPVVGAHPLCPSQTRDLARPYPKIQFLPFRIFSC